MTNYEEAPKNVCKGYIVIEKGTSVRGFDGIPGTGAISDVWLIIEGVGKAWLPYPLDHVALNIYPFPERRELTKEETELPNSVGIVVTGETTGDVVINCKNIGKSSFEGLKIGELRGTFFPCESALVKFNYYMDFGC